MKSTLSKQLAKDLRLGLCLIAVGLAAALGGWLNAVYGWTDAGYFIGIACGGLSGGIGTLVTPLLARSNAEVRKKYELENDERSVFIRQKAKLAAYHFAFYGLVAAVFFSSLFDWPGWIVGSVLLIGLVAVQVGALIIYNHKF